MEDLIYLLVKYLGVEWLKQQDTLSSTFFALADPTRRSILAKLAQGPASVNEIAEPFDVTLAAISKHLKVLERASLITRSRNAQWRPCSLDASPLKQAAEYIGTYRQFWEQSFARPDTLMSDLQKDQNHE